MRHMLCRMWSLCSRQGLCDAGGLAALVKGLQVSRSAAKTAFELLQCLTSPALLPDDMVQSNLTKLASLQAVHHASRLLCPQYSGTALAFSGKCCLMSFRYSHILSPPCAKHKPVRHVSSPLQLYSVVCNHMQLVTAIHMLCASCGLLQSRICFAM